jgi:hypothetical protein
VRLTLRTLLAYLDDTLEPAQAKLIGQKVAESDAAQELIARIKQVTRRRRLTTPPAGPGAKTDPNIIAEYLDNNLSPEQLAEVEEICLASDVHLAEIAACHQILTLVLGEPALVPPTSRQRMYGLVKGPEAIPFRRPPVSAESLENPDEPHEDETLRMGLPAYSRRGTWSQRMALIGGGIALVALLVFAVWQVLPPAPRQQAENNPARPADKGGDRDKRPNDGGRPKDSAGADKKTRDKKNGADGGAAGKDENGRDRAEKDGKSNKGPKDRRKSDSGKSPMKKVLPSAPPWRQAKYAPPATGEPASILLRRKKGDDSPWERRQLPNNLAVDLGDTLVSLPGYRSDVQLDNGLLLTLWGDLPELSMVSPLLESTIELNDPGPAALDLRLDHGRIVIANQRQTEARVRVHFANPTVASGKDVWEILLKGEGTRASVELWGRYPPDVPFTLDRSKRLGPQTELYLFVLKGRADVTVDEYTRSMSAPPPPGTDAPSAPGIMFWRSQTGVTGPLKIPTLPDWALHRYPPFPSELGKKDLEYYQGLRGGMITALENLSTNMSGKKVEAGLRDELKSRNPIQRGLAVRCFGAIDDLANLLDGLIDPLDPMVRQAAIEDLRHWIGRNIDNSQKLFDALVENHYSKAEATSIMRLLHSFSDKQRGTPELYSRLIDYLIQDKAAIRVLAHWHLCRLVYWGAPGYPVTGINYDPLGDTDTLEKGYDAWKRLVPNGTLPKLRKPKPKKP